MKSIVSASILSVILVGTANAQLWDRITTPTVDVTMTHAPAVKIKLDHVAFGPPTGRCADELTDAIYADFSSSGATVIDRAHIQSIIAEHKLNVSGLVDESTAAKIGKLVGAGALIFVKVHECGTTHSQRTYDAKDKKGNVTRYYYLSTRGTLKGSVQAIDMTSGIALGAHLINLTAALENSDGSGNYPPDDAVLSGLQNQAVGEVHRMFFAWSEAKKLHFYNDKECGISTAYQLLRGADYDGALKEAANSVETCKGMPSIKPAVVAHAYYNLGMMNFMKENYDPALEALSQAARLSGGSIITDSMAECRRAKTLSQEMMSYQEHAASASAATAAPSAPSPSPGPKSASGAEERLRKLDDLYKKKLITSEEYKSKRAEILKDF